jgi:hypothetical protein
MNTFTAGTKVRITEDYGNTIPNSDGSFSELHGVVGEVTQHLVGYVEVALSYGDSPAKYLYLFLPEELEAV